MLFLLSAPTRVPPRLSGFFRAYEVKRFGRKIISFTVAPDKLVQDEASMTVSSPRRWRRYEGTPRCFRRGKRTMTKKTKIKKMDVCRLHCYAYVASVSTLACEGKAPFFIPTDSAVLSGTRALSMTDMSINIRYGLVVRVPQNLYVQYGARFSAVPSTAL